MASWEKLKSFIFFRCDSSGVRRNACSVNNQRKRVSWHWGGDGGAHQGALQRHPQVRKSATSWPTRTISYINGNPVLISININVMTMRLTYSIFHLSFLMITHILIHYHYKHRNSFYDDCNYEIDGRIMLWFPQGVVCIMQVFLLLSIEQSVIKINTSSAVCSAARLYNTQSELHIRLLQPSLP